MAGARGLVLRLALLVRAQQLLPARAGARQPALKHLHHRDVHLRAQQLVQRRHFPERGQQAAEGGRADGGAVRRAARLAAAAPKLRQRGRKVGLRGLYGAQRVAVLHRVAQQRRDARFQPLRRALELLRLCALLGWSGGMREVSVASAGVCRELRWTAVR